MNTDLHLRTAETSDALLFFSLRNEPEAIAYSCAGKPLEWSNHLAWFEKAIHSPEKLLLVIEHCDTAIGYIRFDIDTQNSIANVSLAIIMEYRGKGVSKWLLKNGIEHYLTKHKSKLIHADVHIDNLPSKALFEGAGFESVSEVEQFISFELDLSKYPYL